MLLMRQQIFSRRPIQAPTGVSIPGARIPGNGGFIGNRETIWEFSRKWLVVEQMPLVCLIEFGPRAVKLRVYYHARKHADYFPFRFPLGADRRVIVP